MKPNLKFTLIAVLLFWLLLGNCTVLGVENSLQPVEDKVGILQKPQTQKIYDKMNMSASSEEKLEHYFSFYKDWSFNNLSEWIDCAKADDDSIELVIGVNHTCINNYNELKNLVQAHNGSISNTVSMNGGIEAVVADMPLTSASHFVTKVKADYLSAYIEPNLKFRANFIPNDPYWNQQWGPIKIRADYAWDKQLGNSSILVAVIDTGVDWNHPDLTANYVALGHDWVNNDTDPMDDHGHGTHCAGIIAATLNNSIGIAGLAQVKIMAEKGLNQYGEGYEDDLANAIIHAVDQGANILSNSWGDYEDSALIHNAIKYAYEKGVLIVAAAGNNAWDIKAFPAAYEEVIAVSATDVSDAPASFTNFGEWVELATPGVHIYSTVYDNNYTYMSGTSMACPHVSGVAALAWSQFPNATRDWIRLWLRYTADDLGEPGFDVYYGYGRVNAENAVGEPPVHDMLVSSLEAPRYIEPGAMGKINSTVFNFGKTNETNLTVQLLANESIVDSVNIDFLASGTSETVTFLWNPMVEGTYNITSFLVPVPGEDNLLNNGKSTMVRVYHPKVALLQNVAPWGSSSNEKVFDLYNIPYVTVSSEDLASVNISQFIKVVIASDQDQAFYDAMNASRLLLENYVRNGGILEIHAADLGWHSGQWIGILPGELQWQTSDINHVAIVNRTHPVVNTPNLIVESELNQWSYSAHGYFLSYPVGSRIVLIDDSGHPIYLEFDYGAGLFVASGLTLEWAYYHAYSSLLENSLLHPVYRCAHELVAFLEAPIFLVPGVSSLLNATVMNYGLNNETNVELQILIDGYIADFVVVPELATNAHFKLSYLWTPAKEAIYKVAAYAQPLLGEKIVANNNASEIVGVRPVKNVLFDQTHGTDNINVYSIWREALSERGFTVYLHSFGEITFDILNGYDVFVIPQADNPYTPSEVSAIQKFVFEGGGLLVIGDNNASIYTDLTGFAGITWSSCEVSGITDDITPHIVTTGVSYLYLYSPFAKMKVNGAAQDLVRLENGVMLAVSVKEFGKVIGFADENSLWDLGINAMDNLQLANNMIEWLAFSVPRDHEISVRLEAPISLTVGSSVLLNATVSNRGLNNETNIQLSLTINGSIVASVTIPELLVNSTYALSYEWAPTKSSNYNITAYAPPIPGENVTSDNVVSKSVYVFWSSSSYSSGGRIYYACY